MKCKICENNLDNKIFLVKEMMFGFKTSFNYLECSFCGCLQLIDVPKDFSKYYEFNDYYSFKNDGFFKKFLKKEWIKHVLFQNSIIGKFLSIKFKKTFFDEIANLNIINKNTRILDVGSGSGDLVTALNTMGFKNVIGIDPYIEEKEDSVIQKKTIFQMDKSEKFDLILFDHSFEHIPEQSETLDTVFDLLSENGVCMIGIPLKNEHIWNLYGVNWVQIDAPRHLFLHTIESFNLLTQENNLDVHEIKYNSNEFQFWGSEQYIKEIPLLDKKSYLINPKNSIFTADQISEFKNKSEKLNRKKLGDQAIFILKKKNG